MDFSRENARLLKGVAILMMTFHHILGFPGWLSDGNYWTCFTHVGTDITEIVASFCKICVGIYIFITGYSLGISKDSFKKRGVKATRVLAKYWYYYLVFVIIGLIFHEPIPSAGLFFRQMLGMCTATAYGWEYNTGIHPVFAWYVNTYLLFMLCFSIFSKLCRKNIALDFSLVYLVVNLGFVTIEELNNSLSFLPEYFIVSLRQFALYLPIGMLGYLFYRYQIFEKMSYALNKRLKKEYLSLLGIVAIILDALIRKFAINKLNSYLSIAKTASVDFVFVLLFIIGFLLILESGNKNGYKRKLLLFFKSTILEYG